MIASSLADLRDVCARMQDAWGLTRCHIQLDLTPGLINGQFSGLCLSYRDGMPSYHVKVMCVPTRAERIWILAHELRHVMQREQGWLIADNLWHGHAVDRRRTPYNLLPWEIDANAWADQRAYMFHGHDGPSVGIVGTRELKTGGW